MGEGLIEARKDSPTQQGGGHDGGYCNGCWRKGGVSEWVTSWRPKSFGFGILDVVEDVIGFVQVIFDRAFDLVRLSAKICWN